MAVTGRPPAWLRVVLGWLLPVRDREAVLHELDVLYERRAARYGAVRASGWYAAQLPSFALRVLGWAFSQAYRQRSAPGAAGPGSGTSRMDGRGTGHARWTTLEAAARNARMAVRGLRRAPLHTVASVAILGIGVAAVSVVHGVANWALLRPVPGVVSPDELVIVELNSEDSPGSWSIPDRDYLLIAERMRVLPALAAAAEQEVHVVRSAGGVPERVRASIVTASYWDVLGVRMAAGRPFTSEESRGAESPHVVVLSSEYARRYWGRADAAVASELEVNGRMYEVIGVADPVFRGESMPGATDLWVPAGALPAILHNPEILTGDQQVWSTLLARRPSGVSNAAIEADLNALREVVLRENSSSTFAAIHLVFRAYEGIGLEPSLRATTARTLAILGGAALLLLLLSSANVANLGLARAAALQGATTIRRALGAGVGSIVAERLTESVLIGLAGGLLGIALGAASIEALRNAGLGLLGVPLEGVSLDHRVVAFTLLAGALAGTLAGALPAFSTRLGNGTSMLRTGQRVDRGTSRTARFLVAAQVGLSAVLLIGAGLLTRTLTNLGRIDLGIRDDGVVAFDLDPALQGYDRPATTMLIRELIMRMGEGTDVTAVSAVWSPPFDLLSIPFTFAERPDAPAERRAFARSFQVTGAFFETLGLDLVAGRAFRPDEAWGDAEPVAILNESAARLAFPELSPAEVVGRTVQHAGRARPARLVVGVVPDARLERPSWPGRAYVFLPWAQGYDVGQFTIYARTDRPLDTVAGSIREVTAAVAPSLPVYGLRTLRSEIRSLHSEQRLVASLSLGLAGFGLLLAAVGLYGVLALAVTRRTREIGIRCALGARPRRLLMGVVRSAILTAVAGLLPGLLAAAWLSRVLESRLYGVGTLDAETYMIGAATLLIIVLVASWLPARRAMRVDPTIALRHE